MVVGGGITALEIVEGLRAHARARGLLHAPGPLLEQRAVRVRVAGRGGGAARGACASTPFTELGAHRRPRRPRGGRRDRRRRRTIPCDLVAVGIGVRPRIELAEAAGLACGRGILVDEHLRTSDDGHLRGRRRGRDRRPASAAGAPSRCCGTRRCTRAASPASTWPPSPLHVYESGPSLNITRLAGIKTTIIGAVGSGKDADLEGLSRGDSQTWSRAGRGDARRGPGGRRAHPAGARGGAASSARSSWATRTLSFPCRSSSRPRADVGAPARASRARGPGRRAGRAAAGASGRRSMPRRRHRAPARRASRRWRAARRSALPSCDARRHRGGHGALRRRLLRRRARFPAASGLVGHGIGIAGFVLMLMTATLYSLRKLRTDARWGSTAAWLRFHMVTGLVGSVHGAAAHGHAVQRAGRADDAAHRGRRGQRRGRALHLHQSAAGRRQARTPRGAPTAPAATRRLAWPKRRKALATWHTFHVPLTWALFTAAFIHVVAALYYATLQR